MEKRKWLLRCLSVLLGCLIPLYLLILFIDIGFTFIGESHLPLLILLFIPVILLIVFYLQLLKKVPPEKRSQVIRSNLTIAIFAPVLLGILLFVLNQSQEAFKDRLEARNKVYHPDLEKIKDQLPQLSKELKIYLDDSQYYTEEGNGKEIYVVVNHKGEKNFTKFALDEVQYFIKWLPLNQKGYILQFAEMPYSFEVRISSEKEILSCRSQEAEEGQKDLNPCLRIGL